MDNLPEGKMAETELIRAFLDESGTHAGSKITAMAGYLISPDSLPLLEDEWVAVLKKHGMDELHMKEFVPPHGKHSHWSEKEKRAVLEPLISLTREHSLVGIGAAVEMTEFMTTSQAFAHSKSPDLVESPYQWCLRYCMVQAGAWAEGAGKLGPISYTLDEGCPSRGKVQQHYDFSRTNESLSKKYRLGPLAFADSKKVPALQCADLLAYEMYKEADRLLSNSERGTRGSFLALLRDHDRLVTINPEPIKQQVIRGMQINMAMLDYLPTQQKFEVMCYALRAMKQRNREVLLEMNPAMRNVYAACLAMGEMGKRLDEMPRELLPPDDPEYFLSRITPPVIDPKDQ
jgi:hypothetical protein